MPPEMFLDSLRTIVGSAHVLTEAADTEAFLVEPRERADLPPCREHLHFPLRPVVTG